MLTPQNFIAPVCLTAVTLFGVWAIAMYFRFSKTSSGKLVDTEFFLTARKTQEWHMIAYGFFATSVGSGVIFGPASYVLGGGGVIGLACYAFFAGFPLIIVARMGTVIQARFATPMSLGSFAKWRFGHMFHLYVVFNVFINLGIALAVEYTSIGALFKEYLNTPVWVPILVVGLVTMAYTIAGGLYVSILTDGVQSIVILLLVAFMTFYLSITFRPTFLPVIPEQLGVTYMGWSSIATLGIALPSSTIFSDAVWQRVWAAKDDASLQIGACVGAALTITVTFLFAFAGYLAGRAGMVDFNNIAEVNTGFFAILKDQTTHVIPFGILTIVCILAATLNESAVDSFQNAILDTLISGLVSTGYKVPLSTARILVVCLNIPLMILGTQGLSIIQLYLLANLLTTTTVLPLTLGLFKCFDRYVSGTAALFGCAFSILSIFILGASKYRDYTKLTWLSYFKGMSRGISEFFFLSYQWEPFVLALLASLVGVFLYVSGEYFLWRTLRLFYRCNGWKLTGGLVDHPWPAFDPECFDDVLGHHHVPESSASEHSHDDGYFINHN